MNKRKIINDPVYGFITIPFDLVFDLMEHPFFQRLRRIRQLGLTNYVYPGALHTRFHHALGAMHLMVLAIDVIRSKGHTITEQEAEAACCAILLHDVGHSPFSHALENSLVKGIPHEQMSVLMMHELNNTFEGRLQMAIDVFNDHYPKKFLHQLISGQLDMDRLDYLMRDSFYTGVSEGVISFDRIIKMLNVFKDELVIDIKGIYSIEKFIVARRLMYWQVYLHKTVLAAENQLINVLKRAKHLVQNGEKLFATPALNIFLKENFTKLSFRKNSNLLTDYASLDDYDVFTSIKVWSKHDDFILSRLSNGLVERQLYKIKIQRHAFDESDIKLLKLKAENTFGVSADEADYFVFTKSIANNAYNLQEENINILFKDNTIKDIANASDNLSLSLLAKPVVKNILCVDRELIT
ncbi:MAG TPA: HD domain-containing protein [Bacteroidia bacterium]|nr:HD domain-containing protein [Bacteroidia bacterium]HNU34225.1 HD domain-containing protein [Bacteroidia bacterium]